MEIKRTIRDQGLQRLLKTTIARYSNTRPLMNDLGELYTRRIDDRFVTETDPNGRRWLPTKVLSNYLGFVGTRKGYKRKEAYTQAGKWRAAFSRYLENKKILQLTGALRGDIHYQATEESVTIGTSGRIPYAGIQQMGGMAGRGKKVRIPARPYLANNGADGLELSNRDRAALLDRVLDWFQKSTS